MKTQDTKILEWYMNGYRDESFGTTSIMVTDKQLIKSYELGVSHVTKDKRYNVLPDSEILKIIKNK